MSVVRELVTVWGFDIDEQPLKELDTGINTIKASLKAVALATTATAGAIGFLLNRAGGDEQTLIAFETMLGDLEKAQTLMADIKQFADVTPFDTEEVVQAGKQLLAFGIEQENIIEKTERLGNVAAGIGKDKFGTLIRSFGKIRTKGKATMEELNMMLEAGVPILDELAKNMSVSTEELFKMVSTGKVGFAEVDEAIRTMSTGTGKFAGLMEKQSKSLFGLISTVRGQLDNLAKELGAELLPMAKEVVTMFLDWFAANRKLIKQNLVEFLQNLVGFFRDLMGILGMVYKGMTGLVSIFGGWNDALRMTFNVMSAIMGLGIVYGIGLMTKAAFGFALGLKTIGAAAMWANIKLMLIPLAIGAIVTAIALIAEDIYAFTQGRDSVFGRMINGLGSIFEQLKEKFSGLGTIGKNLVGAILTPIRMIISSFKIMMNIIDMIRGKVSFMEGLSKSFGNLKSFFGFGATDSLSGALGLANNVSTASDMASSPSSIPGISTPFKSDSGSNKSVSVESKNEINLNVTGMDQDQAEEFVTERLTGHLDGMLRETVRDGESQVER